MREWDLARAAKMEKVDFWAGNEGYFFIFGHGGRCAREGRMECGENVGGFHTGTLKRSEKVSEQSARSGSGNSTDPRRRSLGDVVQHSVGGRLDVSRRIGVDGSALTYNREDPLLPDLIVARPEVAPTLLEAIRTIKRGQSS